MSQNSHEILISSLIKCVNFAAIKHKNQKRKDPEQTPYINHPIGVAYIIVNEAKIYDEEIILAAILHDTVEDTDTTLDEIEENFGKNVRNIVEEVTDDKSLEKLERKRLQIVNASKSSYKAKIVKLADKLYNLRDLQRTLPVNWTEDRRKEYFLWAREVVNNLSGTNKALEDALNSIFIKNCS